MANTGGVGGTGGRRPPRRQAAEPPEPPPADETPPEPPANDLRSRLRAAAAEMEGGGRAAPAPPPAQTAPSAPPTPRHEPPQPAAAPPPPPPTPSGGGWGASAPPPTPPPYLPAPDQPPPPYQPPPTSPPPYQPPGGGDADAEKKAKWSRIVGIVSIFLSGLLVLGILAIVWGAGARKRLGPGHPLRGAATTGLVTGIISLVLAAIGYGVLAYTVGTDTVDPNQLEVGQCFNSPDLDEILTVDRQSCSKSHQYEVVAAVTHPAADDAPWPGQDAINQFAEEQCRPGFQSYVGISFDESVLEMIFLHPTQDSWERKDDRRLICAAASPDGGSTTGSVKGSAA